MPDPQRHLRQVPAEDTHICTLGECSPLGSEQSFRLRENRHEGRGEQVGVKLTCSPVSVIQIEKQIPFLWFQNNAAHLISAFQWDSPSPCQLVPRFLRLRRGGVVERIV